MFDVNDYEKEIEMFNRPDNKMTLAEIVADALKPENQRVYPIGTRRDWQAELDAQRLRADTAEAELRTERLRADAAVGDANEAERSLAAAEQRIASHEKLLRRIAKHCDGWNVRELHRAIDEIDAALNPNPEAESHES